MKDKFFLDTNIFVYSFDPSNPGKRQIAIDLIRKALSAGQGEISYQVIQEFINVSTRKFATPFTFDQIKEYYINFLEPLLQVLPSTSLYLEALEISERWKFSFYDSLIIASAISSNADILYSEDLQHNQKIRNLTIINPFQSL